MASGIPGRSNPNSYRQRSLWDARPSEPPSWEASQWDPIPVEALPRLPAWRHGLRVILGVRVLLLGFLAATVILGSGHVRGLSVGTSLAGRRPSWAEQVAPEGAGPELAGTPSEPHRDDPAGSPSTVTATALPSATPRSTASPTASPTTTPTATASPSATPTPTAIPSPTEDAALVVVAPTATSDDAAQPAPTVVYPIGPAPVRLVIPSIAVDIPVITVGTVKHTSGGQTYETWDTVADAGAYHKTSAPPGYVGNTVINGHRDILGKVFADLDKVSVGDPITVYTDEREFTYIVAEILVVPEKYASAEQRAENQRLIGYIPEERLTLVTCTPYGTNLNRLLIIARPAGKPRS